ncbi:T3SS effector HopA1 family protein [Emticicia sp. C21]|uniref:T3SS effector HopA1 family protein n=1 Tax=Emticicia sp. C21 TaxID=2302915 RepID=UPI000E3443BA|nr:T3SS effector HopA1 family protein [Emticicia sp. C21]RFS15359.1 hypothetical protein D0T08_17720 [Emticicia sp. C21]
MKSVTICLQEILDRIKEVDFFANSITFKSSNSSSSTAVRVLLSEEYYSTFREYYTITNALHQFIYKIYSHCDKDISLYLDNTPTDDFNSYFKENRPVKELFWQSSYWQYDSQFGLLRKESIKKLETKGRYYEKELINDTNTLDGKPYQNAEKIHPTHTFNDMSEDNKQRYNWINGKYDFVDDYFIRFYWNFYPDKKIITKFLKAIQTSFDNSRIPFQFKFLCDINDYKAHSDVGVLYLPRKHILICLEIVRDIHKEFIDEKFFVDNSPMYTYSLAKGLSFGENPDDRRYTSFGSYRAIHIAMAIIDFHTIQKKKELPTVDDIIKSLNKNNANWSNRFYVNEFSNFHYSEEFRFFERTYKYNKQLIITPPSDLSIKNDWLYENRDSKTKKYLQTAVQIGNMLCKEAIWYDPKDYMRDPNTAGAKYHNESYNYPLNCNWMSFNETIVNSLSDKIGYQFVALNETFVEGRLGVAFFLRKLYRAYKDETLYRTSYRALEGALNQLPEKPDSKYIDQLGWVINEMEDKQTLKVEFFKKAKAIAKNSGPFNIEIKRRPNAWRKVKFKDLIDKVVSTDKFILSEEELKIVDELLKEYFDVERPFGNALGTDEFCATIKDGYALLGYFFLRLYDSKSFRALPFDFC